MNAILMAHLVSAAIPDAIEERLIKKWIGHALRWWVLESPPSEAEGIAQRRGRPLRNSSTALADMPV